MPKEKLTPAQIKEIQELEQWFDLEIIKLRKKQLEILKKYDQRKNKLLQKKVLFDILTTKEYE